MADNNNTQRAGLYCMILILLVWSLITMFNVGDIQDKLDRLQPCVVK